MGSKKEEKLLQELKSENAELREIAERQADELRIEAALERVRARSKGMQKSEELFHVVRQIGEELKELGVEVHNSHIWTDISLGPTGSINIWIHVEGQSYLEKFHFPLSDHPIDSELNEAIDKGQAFFAGTYSKSEAAPYFRYAFKETDLKKIPQERKDIILNAPGWTRFTVVLEESCLHFGRFNLNEFTEEEKEIFKRFGKVFGQAYTRFLDLQKAEEQAREAEIEAALERLRARSMGMHHSTELIEVVRLLNREIKGLGIQNVDATQIATDLSDPDEGVNIWIKVEEMNYLKKFHVPFIDHPTISKLFKASRKKENFYTEKYSKAEKNRLFRLLFKYSDFRSIPEERKEVLLNSPGLVRSIVIHKNSALIFQHNGLDEFSEEHNAIFKRFGVVFEQAYTRFLDLQKAEEQAREAEIEASLERVRAKGMAMHSTNDIESATAVVFNELSRLGIDLERCGITLMNETPVAELWSTTLSHDNKEVIDIVTGYLDFRIHPLTEKSYRDWKEKKKFSTYYLVGEELKKYYDKLEKQPEYKFPKVDSYPDQQVLHSFFFNAGAIFVYTTTELSNESKNIVHRFTKVFEQTYTRFLDLRKAEAQAREAMIEAALERVRARSMAMHKSEQLKEVVAEMYKELEAFDLSKIGCELILCDVENEQLQFWSSSIQQSQLPDRYDIPRSIHPFFNKIWNAWKQKQHNLTIVLEGNKKRDFDKLIFTKTDFKKFPDNVKKYIRSRKSDVFTFTTMKYGLLEAVDDDPLSEDKIKILERFANVFEQTYTRFLDLQKAEEQARESEIQLALERVRARSMSMHTTDELHDVLSVLFEQFYILGIEPVNVFLSLFDREERTLTYRATGTGGSRTQGQQVVSLDSLDVWKQLFEKWMNDNSESVEVIYYDKEILPTLFGLLEETFSSMPLEERLRIEQFPEGGYTMHGYTPFGYIGYNHTRPATEEEKEILTKFASEFSRVYQRFLDIQKAEEQAREAEIQLALERVRAKSMAMQQSDDLTDVLTVIFDQLSNLGVQSEWTHLTLIDLEANTFTYRMTTKEGKRVFADQEVALDASDLWLESANTFKSENPETITRFHIPVDSLPDIWEIFDGIFSALEGDDQIYPEDFPDGIYTTQANCTFGYLGINRKTPDTKEDGEILARFAREFGSVYQRFLDIQKAEEQAREAQIEASLERVRARTMAMQHSDELTEASQLLDEQVRALGIETWGCAFHIYADDPEGDYEWFSSREGTLPFYKTPREEFFLTFYEKGKAGETFHVEEFIGEDCKEHYDYLMSLPVIGDALREIVDSGGSLPNTQYDHVAFFKHGYVLFITYEPAHEAHDIFKRFAKVFEQTYTRFLDLQKAEAQAREAKIEAALERIRSRSMAMQSSDELSDVVRVLYNEVEKLEISNWGSALMIFDDKNKNIQMWFSEYVNNKHLRPYDFDNLNHELVRKWWKFWKSEDEFLTVHLKDEDNEKWTNYLFEDTGMKNLPKEVKEAIRSDNEVYFIYSKMKQGLVSFINLEPFSEEIYPILKRITRTFEQAFTRFLDVQRAEKLALETARQSSLDRIRAEIGSMRSAEDLQQITPIIWDELKTLDIPFIRCGVFIIDEENQLSHTYLSTSQGDPIAALHLPFEDIPLVKNAVSSWKQKEIYTEHWDEEDFREWTQNLIDRGFIQSKKKYEAGSAPETLDLHFLPFKHGMLYIGNTEPLSQKSLDLGQSMAKAFSVAYDRYEDFNKLEQAKQKIEEAFEELEAAKDQLVQQEKLASLGQLTAGIAHEIKNPLNFVNNFSDLSIELVEETKEELTALSDQLSAEDSGKVEEALEILGDIEINLRKIHEHGSRADGIVKSMLQHSRGGSGKMEPTNVNALIKEYANLAFHGMRAGKDPINVDIELDLDENVGKVEMISEDFSRVILNLVNNAFDAMREKLTADSRQLSENPEQNYAPKLTIRTLQKVSSVTIEIQDNGLGIPEEIKDKVLQPFFTTKKGTAGTGLGLSITNDIIKAHGGNIEIVSKETEFTHFTIHLNNQNR